jgi:hypothetical protein
MSSHWSDLAEEFRYLPYLSFAVVVYYFTVTFICCVLVDRKKYYNKYNAFQRIDQPLCCLRGLEYIGCRRWCISTSHPLLRFETIYTSTVSSALLLILRLLSLLYLVYHNVLHFLKDEQHVLEAFDGWTSIAAVIYFTCASFGMFSTLSIWLTVGIVPASPPVWSLATERWGAIVLGLKVLAACNCVFVVIIDLLFFQTSYAYNAFALLIAPAVALVLDILLSRQPMRFEHYPIALTFLVIYMFFQWALAFTRLMNWRTAYLEVHNRLCFGNYSLIFLIHLMTFVVLCVLAKARDKLTGFDYEAIYHRPQGGRNLALRELNSGHLCIGDEDVEMSMAAMEVEEAMAGRTDGALGRDAPFSPVELHQAQAPPSAHERGHGSRVYSIPRHLPHAASSGLD